MKTGAPGFWSEAAPGSAWVESLMATFCAKLAQAAAKLTHTEHPTEY